MVNWEAMAGSRSSAPSRVKAAPAYQRRSAQLREEFLASGDGYALVRGRSAAVDEMVLSAYTRYLSADPIGPPGFCLAALGGYGRRELFPHSDVDLLLLFARQVGQPVPREQIAEFLRELWDAGLRLGHSVRLLAECGTLSEGNTEFSVALMDARFVAGERALFDRLQQETLPRLVQRERAVLLRNLISLAEFRHKKFGQTIYHLEPDVKESPGGLRDYQLACWLSRILRAEEKSVPPREELPETARREVADAHRFLAAARVQLHLLCGRDANTLSFDLQEELARQGRPGRGETSSEHSGAEHPGAEHPSAEHSGAEHPGAEHPSAEHSGAEHPGAEHPGAEHPSAEHPAAEHPGAEHPSAEHSGAEHPGAEHPGAEHPSAEHPSAEHPSAEHPSAEQWMRSYFGHVRHIYRMVNHSLRQSAAPRSTLSRWLQQRQERFSNTDFAVHSGEVFLRNPIHAQRDPGLWLDLFEFQARHGVALSLETERRLERQLAELAEWAQQAPNLWPRFRRILALPHAYTALAAMHELGMLGALFPEFRLIESLVIRDLYHKYTVDEHSLLTIKHLQDLKPLAGRKKTERTPEGRFPARFAEVFAELDHPEPMLLALLFHDLGKSGYGEHVQVSLRLVDPILARLKMEEAELELVRFLVGNHLLMSTTLGTRDLSDPETIQEFAARMGTTERLKMLCLFTYADIQSVNPGALTPWKEEMLWQLYLAAHNELTRQLDTDRAKPGEMGMSFRPEVDAFLEGFPRRYLKTHTPAEILAHFGLAQQLAHRPVQFSLSRHHGHHQLLVLTFDHPFLFAAITGALAAFGTNIHKVEAFSNRQGIVLDTFQFLDLHRTLELNSEESERLLKMLEDAILGKTDVAKMIAGRLDRPVPGRASYRVETRVRFDSSASAHSTLLEVITRDRPGLLYRISNVLSAHGCNIEVVLADTQGPMVIDVFYVTREGGPLDPEWQSALAKELCRILE